MSIGRKLATSASKGSGSLTLPLLPISIQKRFISGIIYIVPSLVLATILYRSYLILPSLYTTPLLSRKLDIVKRQYLLVVQSQRKSQVYNKGITSIPVASSLLYLAQPSIYSISIPKKADRYITSIIPQKSTPTPSANVATIAPPLAFYLAIIRSYLFGAISTKQKRSPSSPNIRQLSTLSTIYIIPFLSPARPDTNLATTLVLSSVSIYLYCIFLLVYLLYTIGVLASSSSLFLSLSSILGRSVPVIYIYLGEIRFIILVQQAIQGQKSKLIKISYALSSTTQSMLRLVQYLLRKACYVEQAIASGITSTTKGTTSLSLLSSSRKIIPFILQDLRRASVLRYSPYIGYITTIIVDSIVQASRAKTTDLPTLVLAIYRNLSMPIAIVSNIRRQQSQSYISKIQYIYWNSSSVSRYSKPSSLSYYQQSQASYLSSTLLLSSSYLVLIRRQRWYYLNPSTKNSSNLDPLSILYIQYISILYIVQLAIRSIISLSSLSAIAIRQSTNSPIRQRLLKAIAIQRYTTTIIAFGRPLRNIALTISVISLVLIRSSSSL